ncbi:MAG: ABC transporter permease [Flavobacteriales bacterium]|nr:ABC transporter permease [Flavobacteriales bacterium]
MSEQDTYWGGIFKKLKRDKATIFGTFIIFGAILISILGAYIRPDSTHNADLKTLPYAQKKPGFVGHFLKVHSSTLTEGSLFGKGLFFGGLSSEYDLYPFHSYKIENGTVILEEINGKNNEKQGRLTAYSFEEVVGPNFKGDPQTYITQELIISKRYVLGTDKFGRDMLSRLLGGTIISLSVGLIAVLISLIIGLTLGSIAGYFGGWVDNIVMWFINVIWSIPTLLIVIALTLLFGKGFIQVFIAVGLTMWVEVARVVRGEILSIKEKEYVEAAKALGYSNWRIISKHVLPNSIDPVIVISAANFATAILLEAGLSFLGIGTQVPMPSWGYMIKEHYSYITTDLAYLAILPGLCIMLLVLAFTLVGNGLRDALDVRSAKT